VSDMHKAAYLIQRFFLHFYRGTLPQRIKEEWHEHIRRRRRAWWDSHQNKEEYFSFPLQRRIKINLYFDSVLCRLIYCDNFEWRERRFLNSYLRQGDIFIDVGANIGLFTLIASRRVGNDGKVFAFEPCTKTYQRLVRNIELNSMNNVQCLQIALSDRPGQLQMNSSLDGYDAWNSMAPPYAGSNFTKEMVSGVTLDNFVREYNLLGRVRMMKIDVEGWESQVLAGGMETLSRTDSPVLQVEFTDHASRSAELSCQALYHQIETLGYQLFLYDEKHRRIYHAPLREEYPYLNLIASKDPDQIGKRINNG